jgi:SOS response regulatory protein OraA/RecX
VEDPEVVMEAAATFLAVRSRSVHETRTRLTHLGYRDSLVERVIERLLAMHYLDDESFARAWVESRDRSRPRGENALRRELYVKGIERETIAAVLAERAERRPSERAEANGPGRDEEPSVDAASVDGTAAERLLARRRAALAREPDQRKRRQRAYALLVRNGFDPQVCQEAATRFASSFIDDG